jgi:hypothetical protein
MACRTVKIEEVFDKGWVKIFSEALEAVEAEIISLPAGRRKGPAGRESAGSSGASHARIAHRRIWI